jgi:hypothetical protein
MESIHKLRTVAWYHSVADEVGATTAYEVTNLVDELRTGLTNHANAEAKSFAPYANGKVTPSDETVEMVESLLPWTKKVFEIGPKCMGGNAPMWLALGGTEAAVRSVLVWYKPELGNLQAIGATVEDLIQYVTANWFPEDLVMHVLDKDHPNVVEAAYREGVIEISMELLTALICLWRLSMATGRGFPYINYLVTGLYDKAMPDLMKPYGIEVAFVAYCKIIENHHWSYLKKLSTGQLFDSDSSVI